MHVEDFEFFNISCVNADDIVSTGATLESVNVFTIIRFQEFVDAASVSFALVSNGLTSGTHNSTLHRKGLAIDIALSEPLRAYNTWKHAVRFFGGVGLYYNSKCYSLHLDMRPTPAFWCASKKNNEKWKYGGIFRDPKS